MSQPGKPDFVVISEPRDFVLRDVIALEAIEWNDWFRWKTLFHASYFDETGEQVSIGAIKIGKIDHDYYNDVSHTPLPAHFESLSAEYVALGQDESFYENLKNSIGPAKARSALIALNDLASNPDAISGLYENPVVERSLMRDISPLSIKTTFNRIVRGLDRTAYAFSFERGSRRDEVPKLAIEFAVVPNSYPPTNVHVLIGRNGAGKSRILAEMTIATLGSSSGTTEAKLLDENSNPLDIANLVYVSFSAFDAHPLPVIDSTSRYQVKYSYIGLQTRKLHPPEASDKSDQEDLEALRTTLSTEELGRQFSRSVLKVLQTKSKSLWREALETLESDPIFAEADVSTLALEASSQSAEEIERNARELFSNFSSGHKIVLLTVTRLVETVTERSLVLLDEPEGHLHPPLLSAFIRTLSNLMARRNGIAIVATHSPVIVQETPRSAVWRISRSGHIVTSERLPLETFGENIGILTTSVFGLEVSASGFHKMLLDKATEHREYEQVLNAFENQLGSDARAILATWFIEHDLPVRSHKDRRNW